MATPPASRRNLALWSTAVEKLNRLGARAWWALAGLLLLGFVVAWGLVIRVKTANGMIELVNLPKDAEVLVDGEEVAITWPGGGKPAVVTVTAGKHKIMVKKDGLEISGDEVTVQAAGREKFTVRFVASTKLPHELPKDDGADSTRTAKKDVRSDAGPAVKTRSISAIDQKLDRDDAKADSWRRIPDGLARRTTRMPIPARSRSTRCGSAVVSTWACTK